MKKFFQSKGFIVSSLALLCVTILGVCWFVSRDRTGDFRPDESPPSSVTGDWSDGGTQTDGDNGADAYAPGQSTDAKEEYPKVTSQTEDEVVIDFTDTEKPEESPPPVPEGKTEIKDPGQEHTVNPDPSVPEVTAPPAEQTPPSNEPAPGSSNGNGAVYDPVFGWVVPGDVQQSNGDSDGDLNKQVGNMADLLQLNMALLGRHRIVAASYFQKDWSVMYLKRLLAFLCCFTLVFCLFPSSAFATGGNGNIDGGGGGMGQGTSSNFWTPGNDGVRITVVDASSGTAVSSPLDFSNRTQKTSLLHFGKVNKLQYLSGTGLSLQSGAAYSCIKPAQSMPTIVSSKGQSNIEAIKRYFCSEYACMMVAQAARVDYERMIAGEYKLLIEPIAYFTHNGQYYCMTATEAGLYDQMSGGNLRKTMTSLTHKNLPLSMFLEFSDLGISAWTGNTTGKQNNSDIISTLGVGIVWFDEAPPEGEIEALMSNTE